MQAINRDVDGFCDQVEECVGQRHYEASQLAMLARSLQEKKSHASRAVGERLHIAKRGLGFYKGVEKVKRVCVCVFMHVFTYT